MRSINVYLAGLALAALGLTLALAFAHKRIASLEAQVADLDGKVIAVTLPVEDLRTDISSIYEELDSLAGQNAGGGQGGSRGTTDARTQTASVRRQESISRRPADNRIVIPGYALRDPDSAAVSVPHGAKVPENRSFNGASDEDG
ncbi:MAG: hypothetical protein AAGF72_06365 [Pseudomonadota bacterium]